MIAADLSKKLGLSLLAEGTDEGKEVTNGYVCDLLSWVMARGEAGMAWITVQTHLNVVAVACLHDFACVIIPEDIEVPEQTILKAKEEGVAIYGSSKTAYELCCGLCDLEIGK
jgi:hypothetical protein